MKKYSHKNSFGLESGAVLPGLEIAYHVYGNFRPGVRVVWVCHALTASSDVFEWWPGLFGENDLFNPEEYVIICANVLGGCYGTTGPLSNHPDTGSPWFHAFPQITIRDMVNVHRILADHLHISHIDVLIGGSLGGQQAIECSIAEPDRIKHLILIATNAVHSPWGIAFNQSQRMAIEADSTWRQNSPYAGLAGLKAARAIALLSYRNYTAYSNAQHDPTPSRTLPLRASSYQIHQGNKLARRFNAYSYVLLSHAMDSHKVSLNLDTLQSALNRITARTLVIGISSDILFPVKEQQAIAEGIPHGQLELIESAFGHDGFLIETQLLTSLISAFLTSTLSFHHTFSHSHEN